MKLKKLIISLIAFCAIAPVSVNAASSLIVECDKKTVAPNEIINCTIKGKSDKEIHTTDFKISLGDNLSLLSAEKDASVWEQGDADDGWFALATKDWRTGEFNIGTFSVKAGNTTTGFDSNIIIDNPKIIAETEFEEIVMADVNLPIRIGSTVNSLSKLVVDGKEMDLTKDLKTTVDAEEVEISAQATDQKAKVSGTGKVALKYGDNIIDVKVTSEAGTVKTYKLTINRPDNRSSVNSLATITINGESKDLTKELKYTIDAEEVEISAAPTDVKSTVTGDLGKLKLKYGENTFKIKVIAENETENIYTIKITRPGGQGVADDKLEGTGPQTGFKDYVLFISGAIVLAGIGTFIVLKKKGKFIKL